MTLSETLNEIEKRAEKATEGPHPFELIAISRTEIPKLVKALKFILKEFEDDIDHSRGSYFEAERWAMVLKQIIAILEAGDENI